MRKTQLERFVPSGLVLDLRPWEVGPEVWTGGSNIRFGDGVAWSAVGALPMYGSPPQQLVQWFLPVNEPGLVAPTLFVAGNGGCSVTDGYGAYVSVTPAGWTAGPETPQKAFSGGVLNHVLVVSHPEYGPFYFPGGSEALRALPGWPVGDRAGVLRPFGYFLVAGDLVVGGEVLPDSLRWSNSAAAGQIPTQWTPTANNDAGDLQLGDSAGSIIAMESLGASLAVYKHHAAYLIDWVGGQNTMAQRRVSASVGALSRNAVCAFGGVHWLVCDGDLVVFDGQEVRSIASRKVRRTFFSQLGEVDSIQVVANVGRNEIMFCQGQGGDGVDATTAWLYDTKTGGWGRRTLPGVRWIAPSFLPLGTTGDTPWALSTITWAQDASTWAQAEVEAAQQVVVGAAGNVFLGLDVPGESGQAGAWVELEKLCMDCGDAQAVKWARRVTVNAEALAGVQVQVRVGSQMSETDAVRWGPWKSIVVGVDAKCWTESSRGRFISVAMRCPADLPVRIPGFDLELVGMGLE